MKSVIEVMKESVESLIHGMDYSVSDDLHEATARAERLEEAAYRAVHAYGIEPHNVQKALLELRKALSKFRGEK